MFVSRRQLVASAGFWMLFGPTLLAMRRAARADAPKAAKRLLVFFTPNGTVHKFWRPSGTGTSFTFPKGGILEPLATHQKDIVVCDGINFLGFDNHEAGMRGMLTGQPGGGLFGGASVDQFIAQKIGQGSRFPSLEFGVLSSIWGAQGQTRMSYTGAGKYADPEDSPTEAFKRMFGDVANAGKDPAAVDKLIARRKSILDTVRGDMTELRGHLGAAERAKIDAHAEAIRAVEKSLTPGASGAASCAVPTAPATADPKSMPSFPTLGKAQMDLLVLALQCGMTKVASIQWSHTVSPVLFSWLGLSEAHHELSHKDDSNAEGVASFVKAERWFAEQFAYLLDRLAEAPDPAGGTLLDTTLVVWAKELGDSRLHDAKSVPFVLAGRANGALQTGRALSFGGASHQKLLASICQGMGVDTSGLGADGAGLPGLIGG